MKKKSAAGQINFLGNEPDGKVDLSSTFTSNMSLPIHRWFRYAAGFSAAWVREVIEREKAVGRLRILDPFAGSGTVLIEAERSGVEAVGIEAHPFVARIARTKLSWRGSAADFSSHATEVMGRARKNIDAIGKYSEIISRCYPSDVLEQLDRLRTAWESAADGSPLSELVWLTLASILRECSPAGTAQWQYILPKKSKARVVAPYAAFEAKARQIAGDMASRQGQAHGPPASLHREDARLCRSLPDGWADLVITSPPYINNFDYADATRLEMSFFGEVGSWGGLQEAVRKYLIRSCTQHAVDADSLSRSIADDEAVGAIRGELLEVCRALEVVRESHGGKKTYHRMVAAYFLDMARFWKSLRRVSSRGALVCLVVGDSAPYGIHVPVDRWLGELAVSNGFDRFRFEKTRDRNVKWKNRKHRVPLHEGRLWIEG